MARSNRLKPPSTGSDLEAEFAFQLRAAGVDAEQQFRIPPRKYLYDFHIRGEQLLCEVQGGIWVQGKHTRGAGYENDCKKMIFAQLNGYRIFYFTPGMVHSGEALDCVLSFLHRRIE